MKVSQSEVRKPKNGVIAQHDHKSHHTANTTINSTSLLSFLHIQNKVKRVVIQLMLHHMNQIDFQQIKVLRISSK